MTGVQTCALPIYVQPTIKLGPKNGDTSRANWLRFEMSRPASVRTAHCEIVASRRISVERKTSAVSKRELHHVPWRDVRARPSSHHRSSPQNTSLPVSKSEVLTGVYYPHEQLKTCKDKESELAMTSVDDAESDSIVSELSKTSGLHCRWSVRSAIDGDRKVRTCRRT